MIRRLGAALILGLTLTAQLAPLACAHRCSETRSCCPTAAPAAAGDSYGARSCCRFEPSEQTSRTTATVPADIKFAGYEALVAVPPVESSLVSYAQAPRQVSGSPDRSTDTPVSRQTTLRL